MAYRADDHHFLFSGSDDDIDMGDLEEGYDPLNRKQGIQVWEQLQK